VHGGLLSTAGAACSTVGSTGGAVARRGTVRPRCRPRLPGEARLRLPVGDDVAGRAYGQAVTACRTGAPQVASGGLVSELLPASATVRTQRPAEEPPATGGQRPVGPSAGAPDRSRPWRGPFTRWPRASDALLALAVVLASLLLREGPGDSVQPRPLGELPVSAYLLFAVTGVALARRRSAPLAVLGVALAAWALTLGTSYADLGGPVVVALYTVGRHGRDDRWAAAGLAGAVAVLVVDGLLDPVPWVEVAFGAVVMGGCWYAGRRLRLRAERAEQLVREQQAEARRIVAEERTRIARELHDVVAHRVSLMTVQAGAAKTVARDDLEAALRAMAAVEAAGRQALDELRHLLGVLRPDAPLEGTGPQPCLADLPALVAQTRQAGLDVTLTTDPLPPVGLPARVELSAYRIVQEGLTNVLKHAGPEARTQVRVTRDGAWLVVEVSDDGRGATVLPGSSHGVVGMRERALLLGGSLDIGPRPGGGFRVLARLPVQA
jgi:signal transduction histidine kinase